MFWLKCCPRCSGDLYEDRDRYGSYVNCMHCGYYLTEAEAMPLRHISRNLRTAGPPAGQRPPAAAVQ
jgi:uncharacterized C2H2 Zn-finger protein